MRIRVVGLALLVGACAAPRAAPPVPAVSVAPAPALAGEWVVEDIGGGGVIDNVRVTARFESGRMSGMAGCNRFAGSYVEAGATLDIGPLAGTRMACAPALMDLEAKYLALLAAVDRWRIDQTGALFLTAPGNLLIRLRRE